MFIVYCIFKLSNKHKLHILCSWNSRKCKLYGRGTFKKVSFDTIKYHFVIKVSLEVKSIIQDVNPHNLRKSPINGWVLRSSVYPFKIPNDKIDPWWCIVYNIKTLVTPITGKSTFVNSIAKVLVMNKFNDKMANLGEVNKDQCLWLRTATDCSLVLCQFSTLFNKRQLCIWIRTWLYAIYQALRIIKNKHTFKFWLTDTECHVLMIKSYLLSIMERSF